MTCVRIKPKTILLHMTGLETVKMVLILAMMKYSVHTVILKKLPVSAQKQNIPINCFHSPGNENARYNIYRSVIRTCQPDSVVEFEVIAEISSDSGSYIDTDMTLYPEGTGSVLCTDLFRSVMYKIEAVDNTGLASLHSDRSLINGYAAQCDDSSLTGITHNGLPVKFSILNYPNPFNPVTKIKFSLPLAQYVNLKIYNTTGQEVYSAFNNEYKPAGFYSIDFDGSKLPSGVYFYVIRTDKYFESKKMVLIK